MTAHAMSHMFVSEYLTLMIPSQFFGQHSSSTKRSMGRFFLLPALSRSNRSCTGLMKLTNLVVRGEGW